MKHLMPKIALLMLAVLTLASCEKDEEQAVAKTAGVTAGGLTVAPASVVLSKATKDNDAITFTLGSTDFGYKAAVKYTIQVDFKGNNFALPKEIVLDANVLTKTLKGIELNDIALALGRTPGSPSVLQVRVKSEVGPAIAPVVSAPVEVTVTPFALVAFVYVPGDYQGWNPSAADSLISALGDGKYEGVINFAVKPNSLEFKITPKKEWNVAYGDAGGGKVSTSGGNLKVATLYAYKIKLNLNDNTWSTERYSFGVIGDAQAGGWGTDTDMTYNNGTQTWSATLNLEGNKEIKFRLNDDWGTNYGDDGANGSLESGGANIKVPSTGNYRVSFSEVTKTYTLTKL